jgi:heptose-I-phosphate ethanolaminephosphotransferase
MQQLSDNDISFWISNQRNHYDNAILYHDWVLSKLLTQLMTIPNDGQRTFLYTSDHGNEVGHVRNYAGHSPKTEAGYRVPVIIWQPALKPRISHQPINIAEFNNNLLLLLNLSQEKNSKTNWLSTDYLFRPVKHWPYWN